MPSPNLGSSKPNLGGPSGGNPSTNPAGRSKGPSGGPSGGPNSGSSGGPNIGSPKSVPKQQVVQQVVRKKKKKDSSPGLERMNLVNSYPAVINRMLKSVKLLFARTFNRNFDVPKLKDLYNDLFLDALKGQITYLDEMIAIVEAGKDPLNIERKAKKIKDPVRPVPYIKLRGYISEEIERFLSEDEDMLEELKIGLRSIKEISVLKGRMGFWGMLTLGMVFHRFVKEVTESDDLIELEVERMVLRPLFKRFTVYNNLLALILKYAHRFYDEIQAFLIHQNRIGWKIGTKRKGYFVNTWIRNRYKTTVQKNVDYANYVEYFVRSFMAIKGQKSDDLKVHLKAFSDNIFGSLGKELGNFTKFTGDAKQVSVESLLENALMLFNGDQLLVEYNEDGIIINQPEYYEYVGDFLEFILHVYHKSKEEIVVNYSHVWFQGRLLEHPYEVLKFISPAIRGMNVLDERILEPWF